MKRTKNKNEQNLRRDKNLALLVNNEAHFSAIAFQR